MMSYKEKYVPAEDGQLYCRIYESKHPPILVVHGGPGLGHQYLLPQMEALSRFCSPIFYDQRGAGRSNSTASWQSDPFKAYVEDLETIRKAFQLETVTLVGHSWASILISMYARAYPHRVNRTIWLNPVPISSADYLNFVKHRMAIVNQNKAKLDALRSSPLLAEGDPATFEAYYRLYFASYFAKPELAKTLNLATSPQAAINNFKIYDLFYRATEAHPFDLYEDMNRLNQELLIVGGDQDVIPKEATERLHARIHSSKLTLLHHCGHFPYIDQPDSLFPLLHTFLNASRKK